MRLVGRLVERIEHEAGRRWISAINHWGRLGRWGFHVCRDAQRLGHELEELNSQLEEADVREREVRHREGYARTPVRPGEFDIPESERAWGDQ